MESCIKVSIIDTGHLAKHQHQMLLFETDTKHTSWSLWHRLLTLRQPGEDDQIIAGLLLQAVNEYTQAELKRQQEEAKKLRLQVFCKGVLRPGINCWSQGQNPDGAPDGDFMSEAKDWAGELISGQTGTGRILVGGAIYYSSYDRAAELCKIASRNIRDDGPTGRTDRN